jgi:hypothetical protein
VQAINNGRAHRRVALDDPPTHTDIQWPITAVSQRTIMCRARTTRGTWLALNASCQCGAHHSQGCFVIVNATYKEKKV